MDTSTTGSDYVILGNLIIQWGTYDTDSSTRYYTITFPVPFSSADSYAIIKNYNSSATSNAVDAEVSFYDQTATGATTYNTYQDSTRFQWIAIGY